MCACPHVTWCWHPLGFCYGESVFGLSDGESVCFVTRYLKHTLDQYVESDYTIVYFHYGLNSQNKPSLSWLQSTYKEFDRRCVPWGPRGGASGPH